MKNSLLLTALALGALLALDVGAADARRPLATPPPPPQGANPVPSYGTGGAAYGYGMSSDPFLGTSAYGSTRQTSVLAVLADLFMLRPSGIALTVAGGALFLASSPFMAIASIAPPHDAIQRAGDALFVGPAAFTFYRPLGEFTYRPNGVYPIRP